MKIAASHPATYQPATAPAPTKTDDDDDDDDDEKEGVEMAHHERSGIRCGSLCCVPRASISSSQTVPQPDRTSSTYTCMSSRALPATGSGFNSRPTTQSDRGKNSTLQLRRYDKLGRPRDTSN